LPRLNFSFRFERKKQKNTQQQWDQKEKICG
jgi:hypothetical protein